MQYTANLKVTTDKVTLGNLYSEAKKNDREIVSVNNRDSHTFVSLTGTLRYARFALRVALKGKVLY